MPELPRKKVGIIACSGEELPEGTITRLAALRVLEQLRPEETVTICLPLFLAGGEGDRAFAKFYPTIAIDGCEKRCAFHGTAQYSNRPAGSIVVTEVIAQHKLPQPEGKRQLNAAGLQAVEVVAQQAADQVDQLLGQAWDRREGSFTTGEPPAAPQEAAVATCTCGSGIPVQKLQVNGEETVLVALPLIFQTFWEAKKAPAEPTLVELMEVVRIYNAIEPDSEAALRQAIAREYHTYWNNHGGEHA